MNKITEKQTVIFSIIAGGIIIFFMPKGNAEKIIKEFEGLSLNTYKDGEKWAIGYGHNIKIPGEEYLLNTTITINKAEKLLSKDVKLAKKIIKTLVKTPINKNQLDSLTSFVYNIGGGAFKNSRMLKYINEKNYEKAASEFPKWRYIGKIESPALLARRAQEQSLFMS